ncbi:hypothetical protein AAHE18_17G070800 [Arachis hypogaea]
MRLACPIIDNSETKIGQTTWKGEEEQKKKKKKDKDENSEFHIAALVYVNIESTMKLEPNTITTTATQVNVPLLDDSQEDSQQHGSISGAVFNISTTMIGAGIMSIPATIKVLGILPGFILIVFVALVTDVTVEFMLRYTAHGKSLTYASMVGESFGSLGSLAVKICVITTNLGVLIIYFIILGDVLCGNESKGSTHLGILQEWFGIHWWTSRAFALLLVALFIMLPLVMLRRVDSLRYSSAISILLALVFVAICSSMAFYALWCGKTQPLRLLPDFSQVTVLDLFTTVPIFVTGFGFHVNVHPIRAELGKPGDMNLAVRISLMICVGIYFAIGFFGYLLFGDSIMADMLVNFDQNSNTSGGRLLNDIFLGSTTIVCLSFIFPASIILRDTHGISKTKDQVMAIVVIVLAVGTSGIAIWTNLYG